MPQFEDRPYRHNWCNPVPEYDTFCFIVCWFLSIQPPECATGLILSFNSAFDFLTPGALIQAAGLF